MCIYNIFYYPKSLYMLIPTIFCIMTGRYMFCVSQMKKKLVKMIQSSLTLLSILESCSKLDMAGKEYFASFLLAFQNDCFLASKHVCRVWWKITLRLWVNILSVIPLILGWRQHCHQRPVSKPVFWLKLAGIFPFP